MGHDDRELIRQTLAGDAAAFGCLVRRYQDRLYVTLVHFVGSEEDAQDVLQDAFVQAYSNLHAFREQAQFYTWLYRIARNLAISHHRRRKLRQCLPLDPGGEDSHANGHDPIDGGPAPDARLETEERVALVRRCLQGLSDEHREVLVLKEIEDLEYEQIAAVLEIPVGTVRSRLFRARSQLKDLLEMQVREDVTP